MFFPSQWTSTVDCAASCCLLSSPRTTWGWNMYMLLLLAIKINMDTQEHRRSHIIQYFRKHCSIRVAVTKS